MEHSSHVIKNTIIKRQQQQLSTIFLRQRDAVIVLSEKASTPGKTQLVDEEATIVKGGLDISLSNPKVKEILGFDPAFDKHQVAEFVYQPYFIFSKDEGQQNEPSSLES